MSEMSEEAIVFYFTQLDVHINAFVALIFQSDSLIGWCSDIGKWNEFLFQHPGTELTA